MKAVCLSLRLSDSPCLLAKCRQPTQASAHPVLWAEEGKAHGSTCLPLLLFSQWQTASQALPSSLAEVAKTLRGLQAELRRGSHRGTGGHGQGEQEAAGCGVSWAGGLASVVLLLRRVWFVQSTSKLLWLKQVLPEFFLNQIIVRDFTLLCPGRQSLLWLWKFGHWSYRCLAVPLVSRVVVHPGGFRA